MWLRLKSPRTIKPHGDFFVVSLWWELHFNQPVSWCIHYKLRLWFKVTSEPQWKTNQVFFSWSCVEGNGRSGFRYLFAKVYKRWWKSSLIGILLCKTGFYGQNNEVSQTAVSLLSACCLPQLENIGNFVRAITEYGLKPHDIFEANDLFENVNHTQVQSTLIALAGMVRTSLKCSFKCTWSLCDPDSTVCLWLSLSNKEYLGYSLFLFSGQVQRFPLQVWYRGEVRWEAAATLRPWEAQGGTQRHRSSGQKCLNALRFLEVKRLKGSLLTAMLPFRWAPTSLPAKRGWLLMGRDAICMMPK